VTYSQNLIYCDGASSTVIAATTCSIPKSTLNRSPISLAWGVSVHAYVVASNGIGNSVASTVGNGAYILTYPDSPLNLSNNALLTTASQITLTWSPGASTGGVPVLTYDLTFDQGLGSSVFVPLQTGIAATTFTVIGMTAGVTYAFQIRELTSFGYSAYSSSVSVLAA
jgi:hypothetical protein